MIGSVWAEPVLAQPAYAAPVPVLVTDSAGAADAVRKTVAKAQTEAIGAVDSALGFLGGAGVSGFVDHVFGHAVFPYPDPPRTLVVEIVDRARPTDQARKTRDKGQIDSAGLTDGILASNGGQAASGLASSVFADVEHGARITRQITDRVGATDAARKTVQKQPRELLWATDDVRAYNGGGAVSQAVGPTFGDSVFGDAPATTYVIRPIFDSAGSTDQARKAVVKGVHEDAGLVDGHLSGAGGQAVSTLAAPIFGDTEFVARTPVVLTDRVGARDAADETKRKALYDVVGLLDEVRPYNGGQAVAQVAQPVFGDTVFHDLRDVTFVIRSPFDQVGLSDAARKAVRKGLPDPVGLVDGLQFSNGGQANSGVVGGVFGDYAPPASLQARQTLDTAGLDDDARKTVRKGLFESVEATDEAQRFNGGAAVADVAFRVFGDSVFGEDEVFGPPIQPSHEQTDTAGLADTVRVRVQKALREALGLTDAAAAQGPGQAVSGYAGGGLSGAGRVFGIFGDFVFINSIPFRPQLVDDEDLTDSRRQVSAAKRHDIDSAGLTDSLLVGTIFQRTITERLGVDDDYASKTSRLLEAEALGVTDSQYILNARLVRLVEDVGSTDYNPALLVAQIREPTDSAGLTDIVHDVDRTKRADHDDAQLSDDARTALYRPLDEDDVGLTDSLHVYVQTERRPNDPMGVLEAFRREQRKGVIDEAGLADSRRQEASLRRHDVDDLGLTDETRQTRIKALYEALGLDDAVRQTGTHRRRHPDSAGLRDVRVQAVETFREDVDPVGVRDSLRVRLIPPGRVRYDRLRPVFPGRPYVLSAYAQHEHEQITMGFVELRYFDDRMVLLQTLFSSRVSLNMDSPSRMVLRSEAPAGATYAAIYLGQTGSNDGDRVAWDGVQFERGELETAYGPKPDEILPQAVASTMLALGAVTTDRVSAGAITNSLMAVGSIDARTLAPDAVTQDAMAPGSVNTEQLVVGSVVTGSIAAGAITTQTLAANAITAEKIAAQAIGADKIAANAIIAGKIAANAVTAGTVQADAITSREIIAGAITTAELAALAITAEKITANAITAGKIDADAVDARAIKAGAIVADKIAADAIAAKHIAAGAVTAEEILAGSIITEKLAAKAITSEKINALAIQAGHIGARIVEAGHVQTNTLGALEIAAEAIGVHELGAYSVTGKFITGGAIQTGVQGEDRIVIADTQTLGLRDKYGRNYRDVIQWRNPQNEITGEIRGWLGDIGGYGIQLNSHVQLGHGNSLIYQLGRRVHNHGLSTVRMGSATATITDGVGSWRAPISPGMPTTVSAVVVSGGDIVTNSGFLYSHPVVTGWDRNYVYGRVYVIGNPKPTVNVSLSVSKDANGFVKDVSVSSSADLPVITRWPGQGSTFAIRYYAECMG